MISEFRPIERRKTFRKSLNIHGLVRSKYLSPTECTICNISPGGALIILNQHILLPQNFHFFVPQDQFRAACEVRHVTGCKIGIEFVSNRCEALRLYGDPASYQPTAEVVWA